MHRLFILAVAALTSGSAAAKEDPVADRLAAYRACPSGGVSLWLDLEPAREGSSQRRLRGLDARWAGEPDWIEPRPVPDAELAAPTTWLRPESVLDQHRILRAAGDRPVPEGADRILLFKRTEHWAWFSESTIAIRGDDGRWNVDYLRRYDDGTQQANAWALPDSDARRLDGLVVDSCLAREPFQSDFAYIRTSDNARWTLEVEGSGDTVRVAGVDSGFGRAGGIQYLLRTPQ